MMDSTLKVLAVIGSMRSNSVTRAAIQETANRLSHHGCTVDILDLRETPLAPYNPETSYGTSEVEALKSRVAEADVIVLGSPDYHGSISCTLKNFTDHFWKEFTGKLFACIVSSHEKGLTVHDQLRTVARQCYAWTLPYGVSLEEKVDVQEGKVVSDTAIARLGMMVRDIAVYGQLLRDQRLADLAGSDLGYLARLRR